MNRYDAGIKVERIEYDDEVVFLLMEESDIGNSRLEHFERGIFDDFFWGDGRNAIVDLSCVEYIDSSTLASLIRMRKLMRKDNREFYITNPQGSVLEIFQLQEFESFILKVKTVENE